MPSSDPKPNLTLQQLIASLSQLSSTSADSDLELIELNAGDVLFEQGDDDNGIYVIVAGSLGVRMRHADGTETEIDRHAPGAIVGEMAVLSGQKRSATVYAINDVGLFHLSRAQYEELAAEDPRTTRVIGQDFDSRWQVLQLSNLLRNLLGDIDALALQAWHKEMEWLRLSNGDVVFRQGDAPDGMYVVVNGRLRIVAENEDGEEQISAEITPGETVGEFALITGEPRSATAYAMRDSSIVKISTETFNKLAQTNPHFMAEITKIIVTRQQRLLGQGKPPAPTALSIALIPATASADIETFAQQLAQALQPYGTVDQVTAPRFDALYGKAGAAQTIQGDTLDALIAVRLDELESAESFILYTADPTPTAWTRRCLGRADRVIILADPQDDPTPGAVEQLLGQFEVPVRTELVLWHPQETDMPTGTGKWLAPRDLYAHHHVRKGTEIHMQRLARRLTGHAIALVFSGGGALGFTEMGVYKALLELDIPFDYVGGTSMGAIMTGAIASGLTYAEFEDQARLMAKTGVMDITLPLAALTASKNASKLLQEMFGKYDIEDLWLPYFCVSCNYSTAETVVHRRGSLWRAIRASMSVPGVFLPVIEDGNVLVDGGIMDNFPVEAMLSQCESDGVIGVVINPFRERMAEYDYDTSLSGWKILWSRINPFSKRLRTPSMLKTLTRASEINGMRASKHQEGLVDVLITPNVRGFSFTDYDAWQALAQNGYEAALEPLRKWKVGRSDLG